MSTNNVTTENPNNSGLLNNIGANTIPNAINSSQYENTSNLDLVDLRNELIVEKNQMTILKNELQNLNVDISNKISEFDKIRNQTTRLDDAIEDFEQSREEQEEYLKKMTIGKYLPEDEEAFMLDTLNTESNKIIEKQNISSRFENKTVKQVFNEWTTAVIDIMNDITKFIPLVKEKEFENNWWDKIVWIVKEVFKLATKDHRSIYIGLTLIFISMFLSFIRITE